MSVLKQNHIFFKQCIELTIIITASMQFEIPYNYINILQTKFLFFNHNVFTNGVV